MKKFYLLLIITLSGIGFTQARYYCNNLCWEDAQNLLGAGHYYLDSDLDGEACEWSPSCYYYTSTPTYNYVVTCGSNQCKLNGTCYNKPSNASCANTGNDARLCNAGYYESGYACIKESISNYEDNSHQSISNYQPSNAKDMVYVSDGFKRQNGEILKWMYNTGLTKYNSRSKFRPHDFIARGESAKFLSAYGGYLGIIAENTYSCVFNDTVGYDYTLTPHIQKSCQMGMIKGHNGNYYPKNNITKGEALAVVLRPFVGLQDEGVTPRYQNYYNVGNNIGFTKISISNFDEPISRFELGNRMYETIVYYMGITLGASNDNDFWNISCQVKYPGTHYNLINQMCVCDDGRFWNSKLKACPGPIEVKQKYPTIGTTPS